MTPLRFLLLLPAFFTFAALHALPYLPRRGRLFGVAVPAEVRRAQGREMLRRYQWNLLPWTALAILIFLVTPIPWLPIATLVAPLVPLVPASLLFLRNRREALRFALPQSPVREAQLTAAGDRPGRRLAWFVPPFALLGAAALYLRANWERIPARFAIHWDLNGQPNGWSNRSAGSVYGPLVIGALIVILILALAELLWRGSRKSTLRSAALNVLAVVAYLIAIVFTIASLSPFWVPSPWLMLGLVFGCLAVIVIVTVRAQARPEPEEEPGESTPEGCWHGPFYYNPGDPVLFVEKRAGLGFDFNYGNRLSWVILAGTLVYILAVVVLAIVMIGAK